MRLAVIGSPIGHSKSPAMHSAAYRVLGLSWSYDARDVPEADFDGFTRELNGRWRGLSVTAPLKGRAHAWARQLDEAAQLTASVNTLLVQSRRGFNTDVHGIIAAFGTGGSWRSDHGTIIGAGATAMSALVALRRMGVTRVQVRLRELRKAAPLEQLAGRIGVEIVAATLDEPVESAGLVVSTLPASAAVVPVLRDVERILDADYARGFSRFELDHEDAVVSGLEMLASQALAQVRIFVGGDPERTLPNEPEVWRAMRAAAGLE